MLAALAQPDTQLTLDLSDISAIDTAGIDAIAETRDRLATHDTALIIEDPSPTVRNALTQRPDPS